MDVTKFKKHYDALLPLPDYPGEMNWVLRVNTWVAFVQRGQMVTDHLEMLFEHHGAGEYYQQFRSLQPGLHDLLMEAYGKVALLKVWRRR